MALTGFQRSICRLIAAQRRKSGESYVAGGTALNAATGADRISRDIDLFHDTATALVESWNADREFLEGSGYDVVTQRERATFVEALVSRGAEKVIVQWSSDSAFRFFPLVEDDDFGLVLHPFDLATNKVLALVGRVEARDWVDVITCHERIQRLGYLAWAASGKDPGFGPASILEEAGRSARYSTAEIEPLAFANDPPDVADLSRRWHAMLAEAREIVSRLPSSETGKCILDAQGDLFRGDPLGLRDAVARGSLRFHPGRIRGAFPQIRDP